MVLSLALVITRSKVLSGSGIAGAVLVLTAGCREPTEIVLVISTTLSCDALETGIAIAAGVDPVRTEGAISSHFFSGTSRACGAGGELGTLVVTPGAGAAAIVVVAGVNGQDTALCTPDNHYKDCVVARRSLSFVDHVPLTVPIELTADCLNVPCDARNTCLKGTCVDAYVACGKDGCASIARGGEPAPDAGPLLDASVDATLDAGDGRETDAATGDGGDLLVPGSDVECVGSLGGPMAFRDFMATRALKYCIDRTEVTQGQYRAFLNATVLKASGCPKMSLEPDELIGSCDATTFTPGKTPDFPVVCVDHCDAVSYCAQVGKRLCEAEEWSVACQNGDDSNVLTYGGYMQGVCNDLTYGATHHPLKVASLNGCVSKATTKVFDMTGNVWEWLKDGSGAPRGGGFMTGNDSYLECRQALGPTEILTYEIGFRCCKTVP